MLLELLDPKVKMQFQMSAMRTIAIPSRTRSIPRFTSMHSVWTQRARASFGGCDHPASDATASIGRESCRREGRWIEELLP